MLSKSSSLRRIPSACNPKQAIFLDGLRHSAEIITLAYTRLRSCITDLALYPPSSDELQNATPYVFLDAWAFVDAVDKFRLLYQNFPDMVKNPLSKEPRLEDVTKNFKKIRDIADHCNGTADRILANGTSGLGYLTWITIEEFQPVKAFYCTIRPGTLQTEPSLEWPRIEATPNDRTFFICLTVGGVQANLTDIMPHIEKRIKKLEENVDSFINDNDLVDTQTINDVLIRQPYTRETK
ncbi:hypothetical protein [Cellvibrio polysaccharolyticus]|uniref:hypothetical protein n=1 Tax=Cellvibrio polysaccharolyticus TaxID=2082724 RepID=UPI0018830306|nr:hypothetical protein [Cellvibrio polysaccharolyticus]